MWQKSLLALRDERTWSSKLNLRVSIDGMKPTIRRELMVSPQVSLAELHHQVLCPAMGWTPDSHAYAFRRTCKSLITSHHDCQEELYKKHSLIAKALRQECWVGPQGSTALDRFFLPQYIGGAFADDRSILLGDMFYSQNSDSQLDLQYVYDIGDWWSHTIEVSEARDSGSTAAAELLSGKGTCPADNTGGIHEYLVCSRKFNVVKHPTCSNIDVF